MITLTNSDIDGSLRRKHESRLRAWMGSRTRFMIDYLPWEMSVSSLKYRVRDQVFDQVCCQIKIQLDEHLD